MTSRRCAAAVVATGLVGLALTDTGRAAAQKPAVTAFVDVSVIPMDYERVLPGQTVVVQGDHIVALGPVDQVPVPAGAMRVDGRRKFLIPGLADLHVHFDWISGPIEAKLFAFVANGVTTVRDMHGGRGGSYLLPLRTRVARGELLGPRIYAAGDLPPEPGTTPAEFAASVRELKAAGFDFVKLYDQDPPGYDSIIAAAQRVGLRVAGHVPFDVGVEGALASHWASIEHLMGYLNYVLGLPLGAPEVWAPPPPRGGRVTRVVKQDSTVWLRPGYQLDSVRLRHIAAETARAGVWNCPTLAAMEQALKPVYLAFNFQITKALQAADAGLLLGTDTPFGQPGQMVPGFSVLRELALLVQAGLTPYQALEAGTRNTARFLGTEDSTGTVAVGKRADLVLLYDNPLREITATAGPAGVMVAGRWLARADLDARLDSLPASEGFDPKAARAKLWRPVTP